MDRFPIQDGPSVPWEFMLPHEAQCRINHGGQSLEAIAKRGGLGAAEAFWVVTGFKPWYENTTKESVAEARKKWFELAERVNREAEQAAAGLVKLTEEERRFLVNVFTVIVSSMHKTGESMKQPQRFLVAAHLLMLFKRTPVEHATVAADHAEKGFVEGFIEGSKP